MRAWPSSLSRVRCGVHHEEGHPIGYVEIARANKLAVALEIREANEIRSQHLYETKWTSAVLQVKRDVAFVVTDEVELNLGTLRAIQQSLVENDGFRRNALLGIGHAVVILPASGFQGGKAAQDITVLLGWIFPVGTDRSPVFAQTFFISISVLGDERCNPLRVVQCETEPGGGTIIEDVDRKLLQADLLRELPDDLGQMVKRIGEAFVIRRVRESMLFARSESELNL